jgi:NADPH-dependent curcumin reductase CurA
MQYTAIKLIKRPEVVITPDLFEVVTLDKPELKDGEFLMKQTHMSLDPAMKGWMSPDRDSYIPPVELGDIMRSSGVGEVVETKNAKFPVGARVQGMTGWSEYIVSNGERMNVLPEQVPTEAVLCVLALPGMTAYQGLMNIGKPKAGETIVVSGAAGSVGSLVGQIAKAEGLTVIGTAGTDDKCKWLVDELGFDAAINYKSSTLNEELKAAAPKGVDLFFENTGGTVQHAIFDLMNAHGRIMVCGMISDYNTTEPSAGPNWIPIIKKRLSIQGFTMPDHYDQVPQMMQAMSKYLMEGKIKYRAHTLEGLESAIEGINLLFTGGNTGKLLVKL